MGNVTPSTSDFDRAQYSASCKVRKIPLDRIEDFAGNDSRYSRKALQRLMGSISRDGQIGPVTVRHVQGTKRFELLTGRRRYWACRHLGNTELLAFIVRDDNRGAESFQLPDNLQRDAPDPLDIAAWLHERKRRYRLTDEDLALEIGRSRSHVTQLLGVHGLSDELKALAQQKAARLTCGFLIELLQFGDEARTTAMLSSFENGTVTRTAVKKAKLPRAAAARGEANLALAAARQMVRHVEQALFRSDGNVALLQGIEAQLARAQALINGSPGMSQCDIAA